MRSEAQKRAEKNYQERSKGKFSLLQCKIDSETAEEFRKLLKADGNNVNAFFTECVNRYLEEHS